MCSNPQEIINKATGELVTVACRSCDDCIATRRHGWVARAMAEKATSKHTLCVALTYDDSSQANRDAAAMFCYRDVREFMDRLRSACARQAKTAKLGYRPSVRFICAGEQGSRNGRCHWHLILYSDLDLTKVGVYTLRGRQVSARTDLLTSGKHKRRLNWSLWGKGFVTLQEPDQGGMNYVLSYCLKDQFTHEKSEGTMREARSEDYATGLFRMSKKPSIGERWLIQKMEDLDAKGAVLPHTQLQIPGFRGFYHPNGLYREKLLRALVAINNRVVMTTGAPAPQWSALLASCKDSPSDMEILNGQETGQEEGAADFAARIERDGREVAFQARRAEKRRGCGALLPCDRCLRSLSDEQLSGLGVEAFDGPEGVRYFRAFDGQGTVYSRQTAPGPGLNPYCQERGSKLSRFTFPDTDRTIL